MIYDDLCAELGMDPVPELPDLAPVDPPSAKRYRRPWVGVEAYAETQVLPVVMP